MNKKLLKEFENGVKIYFQRGKIDDYMVTINDRAPKDITFLKFFSLYDKQVIWQALQDISNQIDRQTEDLSSFQPPDMTSLYPNLSDQDRKKRKVIEDIIFHAYAACLIAEERRSDQFVTENNNLPRIGKRVKLLAAYQLLFEGLLPEKAANFSRGMKSWEIDAECKKRDI